MRTIEELGRALAKVSPGLRDEINRVWYEGSDQEFWAMLDWLAALPEPPVQDNVDDYVRSQDPSYWDPDELREIS